MERIRGPDYIVSCPRCGRGLTLPQVLKGQCKGCLLPIPERSIGVIVRQVQNR